jgi:hypothetical protein
MGICISKCTVRLDFAYYNMQLSKSNVEQIFLGPFLTVHMKFVILFLFATSIAGVMLGPVLSWLLLSLVLVAVVLVDPIGAEEPDCPEFECPAKVDIFFHPQPFYIMYNLSILIHSLIGYFNY